MQFYPHNLPVTSIATAVSASLARTGSLITNFSAVGVTLVNTASLALNISGSRGAAGTNIAVIGPTGPTGLRGDTGYRGGNIFLLSGSWNVGTCGGGGGGCGSGPYTLNNIGPGAGECGSTQGSSTYWSSYAGNLLTVGTDSTASNDADDSILYINNVCTSPAINVSVHNGSTIFYTDGAGVISSAGCSI